MFVCSHHGRSRWSGLFAFQNIAGRCFYLHISEGDGSVRWSETPSSRNPSLATDETRTQHGWGLNEESRKAGGAGTGVIKSGRRDGKFPRFGSTDPAQRNVWEWSAGLHPAAPLTPSMPGGRLETGDPSIRPFGWPVKPSEPHPTFITHSGTWVPPFLLSSVARLDSCSSRGSSVAPLNPNSEVAVSIMTRIARANFPCARIPTTSFRTSGGFRVGRGFNHPFGRIRR